MSAINAARLDDCVSLCSPSAPRMIAMIDKTMKVICTISFVSEHSLGTRQKHANIILIGGAKLHTTPTVETGKNLIDMNAIMSEAPP